MLPIREHMRLRYGLRLGVRKCQHIFHQTGIWLRWPGPHIDPDCHHAHPF